MKDDRLSRLKKAHDILKPFITEINLDNIAQAVNDSNVYGKCVYETFKYYLKNGLTRLEERIQTEEKSQAGASVLKKTLKVGKLYEIRQTTPKKYPKEQRGRIAVVQIRSFGLKSIGVNVLAKNFDTWGELYKANEQHQARPFSLIFYGEFNGGTNYCPDGAADLTFKEIQTKDLPMYMTMQTTEHFDKAIKGG